MFVARFMVEERFVWFIRVFREVLSSFWCEFYLLEVILSLRSYLAALSKILFSPQLFQSWTIWRHITFNNTPLPLMLLRRLNSFRITFLHNRDRFRTLRINRPPLQLQFTFRSLLKCQNQTWTHKNFAKLTITNSNHSLLPSFGLTLLHTFTFRFFLIELIFQMGFFNKSDFPTFWVILGILPILKVS